MKTLLNTLLLIVFCYSAGIAQDSVTITQKGSGNTAVVTQSAEPDSIIKSIIQNKPCFKSNSAMKKDKNVIILKSRDGSGKNVYKITGKENNKLYVSQKGNSAESIIGVWKSPHSVTAAQQGAKNGIVLYLNNMESQSGQEGDKYDLAQEGSGNSIYIGPCGDDNLESTDSNNKIDIEQKGEGNSVVIEQG